MKRLSFKAVFLMAILVFVTSGCSLDISNQQGSGDNELHASAPTPFSEEILQKETQITEDNSPEISDQAYVSQSGAYKIALPEGWNCSETGDFQVNCQSPDQSAALQVEITATGYELDQPAFVSFSHAELVNSYSKVKEYVETKRFEENGHLIVESSWRVGNTYWQGTDMFLRKNGSIFHLITTTQISLSEKYADLYKLITESIEIMPSALQGVQLYANRITHMAPDAFFEVDVPTSWGKYIDATAIKNAVIEGFLSPDMHAAVQIVIYRRGTMIGETFKASKTLEIMHAQYGTDMRVSHDKALPDGRERLAWYAEKKGISGISYFDSFGSTLYVFSIVWEESTAYIYQPLLEEISASFYRK